MKKRLRSIPTLLSGAISVFACCYPASAAKPMPSLAWVLKMHDAAVASPGILNKPTTEKAVYTLSAEGLTGTLTEYDAPPHKTRVEMTLGPVQQVNGDDGKTAWVQDMTGHVRIVSGPELVADRAAQSFNLEGYDPIRDSKRGRITLRPQRDPATGDYILDLAPVGGTQQTIYLDPHTFLAHKLLASHGGINGIVVINSYKRIDGEAVPSAMQISYAGLPITVTAQLQSALRGLPLDPALFAPPTAKTADFAFLTADGKGPATISYEDRDGEIVLPVTINGKSIPLLLDTGAGSSFLTADAAKSLNLTLSGDVPTVGYGGLSGSGVATHATVELPGAVRVPNETLYVLRDAAVGKSLSEKAGIEGALGYDLFSRFVVTIDYATKTVTLTDPATYTPPAGADIIPLRLDTRTPSIDASVDGRPAARFLIDTGDNGAIHLYTPYAKAQGLLPPAGDADAKTLTGVGIGGAVNEIVTPGHTLKIGDRTVTDIPVAVIGGGGVTSVLHQAGGIGDMALSHFLVTFDYTHNRLILQKPPSPTPLDLLFTPQAQRADTPEPTTPAPATPAPATPAPTTTQELLARHLQALGGKAAVSAITSTRVNADVTTGGLHGIVVTIYSAPENEYEEDHIGILDITQAYNGKDGWQRDTNGSVRPLGPDEIQNLRNQLYFDTNSYVIPGIIKGKITLRPQRDPSTGDYVLDALPEGGKPTQIYINPHTFLIDLEKHKDDNVTVTTSYTDYKPVNGVEFPFSQHTTNGDTRYDISLSIKDIENNVTVPQSLFDVPKADFGGNFITPGATTATVPFDFSDSEIRIAVSINGQSGYMFLDSGSSGIALSKATADALKLPQSGFLEARGYGGSTDLLPVKIDTFQIPGAVQLNQIAAVAVPLPPALNSFLSKPIMGFVGYDLLAHFVVRIDFPKKQITFIAPQAFHPTAADGTALPISLDNDIPTVSAQLDDLPAARYLVDTGDEATLRLYGPYVTKNGLDKRYPNGILTVGGGVGGASAARLTRVGSFTVAGVTLHDVPTAFSLDKQGGASRIEAGSIGAGLLSRFVVTFDYPHSKIYFAPGSETNAPFDTHVSGLELGLTGKPPHVVITGIRPDAPARFSDIHPGDALLSIDGVTIHNAGPGTISALLSDAHGKLKHTLVVQTGNNKPRTVTISLYDPLTAKNDTP